MRGLLVLMIAGCTIGTRGPDVVTAPPPPYPDQMPSAVLENQDPGANTAWNPVLSRYGGSSSLPNFPALGCLRFFACNTGSGGDASGALVVLAAVAATRRRKRS